MKRRLLMSGFVLVLILGLLGCGAVDTGSDPTYRAYVGSLAKGDLVQFTLASDSTLVMENQTSGETITAKYRPYTIPTLNVQCLEAYDISVDGVPVPGLEVPFVELEGIALVVSMPNGLGEYDLAVYTYGETPVLNGTLDGEYYFMNVITGNSTVLEADFEIGSYEVAASSVTVTCSTYADPSPLTGPVTFTSSMNVVEDYILVPIPSFPTASVALTPAGVMIIDKGPGCGIAVGTKIPTTSYPYDNEAGNTYLFATSSGTIIGKAVFTAGEFLDLTMLDLTDGSSVEYLGLEFTQDEPGFYSASFGGGTIKFALLSEKVFFGVHSDGTNCDDSFIGVKVD